MASAHRHRAASSNLFAQRPFQVVFLAEAISVFGTQLARFALSFLIFDRTGSAAAAALSYATSFLPAALGGVLIGGLGDRFSQRTVMVGCDVVRAALFCAMALPGLNVGVILALLAVAVFFDPAFSSALVAYLARMLPEEQLRSASGLRATVDQVIQVIGFGAGGAVVALIGARSALLVDAVTFVVCAVLIALLLPRPRGRVVGTAAGVAELEHPVDGNRRSATERRSPGARFGGLWRERSTRLHMAFAVLIGLYVLPEAVAVAYGAHIGASTTQVGVLLAMIPLGSAVGCAAILRVSPARRARVANVFALSCGVPLAACIAQPGWATSCALWFASGLLSAYQVEAIFGLVRAIPAARRSALLGIASTWLTISQGVSFALGGLLAQVAGAATAVAIAGGLGVVATTGLLMAETRGERSDRPVVVPSQLRG